ncbi:MAG TPA: thiamine pyrophosphate-dependent enzyme [Methylomusa anaerophila]|uniref:2-oxoglutarate oxidoreductase subunit KorB n=1 Tax=Methylomusa anaerophila TaxID=1930071 RepID=A0A348APS7_9FIRM|nr:thiamine pyrophosphate-dependent enzyme [Methylomusa anaerophila]BBB93075.1 2-oxoglutarate oxidoreductase subunit KorB [Methylomusa anaerophila]HML87092.1 thiamine pyrophosphate-dependent enzyme [Methylomusa anaerophila]
MEEKIEKIFARPHGLKDLPFHYCPGCHHGIIQRLVAEVIDELGVHAKAIAVAPVGCSVLLYEYFSFDACGAAHGRAPAVATGVKRVHPDAVVFTYQGDGDLAAIGCAEIIHAAARGEKITTIYVNNAIYGMTGGQMAPTTLVGQVTTTSPYGRNAETAGHPVKVAEMLATLDGAKFIARAAVNTPANMTKAKLAIKKAFEVQLNGEGFSLVELLSTCPTNWGMSPIEASKWLQDKMIPYYPLGIYKTVNGVGK